MNYSKTVEEIEALREQLEKEEAKLADFKKLTPAKQLAVELHESQCHWNHTDGCFWFYGRDDDAQNWESDRTRKDYLEKSEALLKITDYETVIKIINVL